MKKHGLSPSFWLLLLVFMGLLCCLSACQDGEPAAQPLEGEIAPPEEEPDNFRRLILATGPTSGNYYPYGSVLSQLIDDELGHIRLDITATTASVENIEQLAEGQAHLAIVQNDVLSYAFHGLNIWAEGPPATNIRSLLSLYPEICQLIVGVDSDIQTVADLRNKRVALGELGSALSVGAKQILEAYELGNEDIEPVYLSFAEATEALRGQTIDAFFVTVGTPNKAIMDLQAECPIRIIGLGEEQVNTLIEKYPFYTRATLNESDYSFLTEPVQTVAVRATLVASASLGQQEVYTIVKTIMEGREKIAVAHAKGAFISPETALSGLDVELHPGAAQYFQEIGLL